jgi:hypothetical protein
LSDGSDVFVGNVTCASFERLVTLAIDFLGDYFRTANLKLEPFTAHILNKNCKLKFSTTCHAGDVR